jgi:uncharacterized membrane protein YfcA
MSIELATEIYVLLLVVGFIAGSVDAIAGGGGLITVPALLWAGLPPTSALATNKLQSSWGTAAATVNFLRNGQIDLRAMLPAIACTFAGAAAGTLLIQRLDSSFLAALIPLLLVAAAAYFLLQPRLGEVDRQQRIGSCAFAVGCASVIGFYDGFFGPGTGSFFAVAFVALRGFNLVKATAHTKLLNLTSNLASLLFFILGGHVVWSVGLCMAGGQIAGGMLGSHLTLRHGSRLVRPLLVIVSIALTLRFLLTDPASPFAGWLNR